MGGERKGNLQIFLSLLPGSFSPEVSHKRGWIESLFFRRTIFPLGLGLKIYYLCTYHLLTFSPSGASLNCSGRTGALQTFTKLSLGCVGVSSRYKNISSSFSHVTSRKSCIYGRKKFELSLLLTLQTSGEETIRFSDQIHETPNEELVRSGRMGFGNGHC